MKKLIVLLASHAAVLGNGFALGIDALPILTGESFSQFITAAKYR